MALKYQQRNDPLGSGNLFSIANIAAFGKFYGDGLVAQLFSNGTATIPGATNTEFIFADSARSQIGLVSNGQLEWIAGVFGVTGYRDGPGNQALFAMWNAGYPVVAATLISPSVGYVSDSANGAIRKLEKQADGTWNVSTIYNGGITVLTLDSLGNLWFPDGSNLNRLAPDGTISKVPTIRQRTDQGQMLIYSMCADKVGNVYLTDNINAASVFYRCGQDMVIHHVCGIDQAEMNQILDSGLPEFQDGDGDHSSFHHDNVICASDDGSELYVGGGDEQFLRRFKDGQSATLGSDGYWHQFGLRSSADPGLLTLFYPAGVDPVTKSILATMPPWTTIDTWGAFKNYDLIESTDVPFKVLSAEFTDWKNVVLPFKMVTGQTYTFVVAFANGGDSPWTKTDGWRCVAADSNPFGVPDQQLGDTEQVLPGQVRRFTFSVTPNVPPGKYLSRFGMGYKNLNVYGLSPGDFTIYATQADLNADVQPSGGKMQGFLDGVIDNNVTGWCVDGTSPVSVDIMIDGAVAATVVADVSRPDLVTANVAPDPNHGVSWAISDVYKDSKPHTAGIRYNGTMLSLSNGAGNTVPFTIASPTPAPTPTPVETHNIVINWTTQDQLRADFANFGKFRLSVGSMTPVMITDLTLRTYTMSSIPVGTYNVELALVSLDGATVAGTITGVLNVTSTVTPTPVPAPEQNVPVPATLSFVQL